jgi:hypothetical protein
VEDKFIVRNTNDISTSPINRLRHKNRRDFPWAVVPSFTKQWADWRIYGLFSDKEMAEKFATLMNVQIRLNKT